MGKARFLFGLMVLSILFLIVSSSLAAEKARFASHAKTNVYFVLPVVAALEKGYWKEEGLDVLWLPFDASTTMVQAVAAGEVDMGTLSPETTVLAVARGVPMVIVADPRMDYGFAIWVPTDSPLKEPKELKGKKIGVTRFGGSPHRMAEIAVKALGIEKEIKFVALGGGGPATAAFRARAVDGVARDNLTMAALKATGEARVLVNLSEYAPASGSSSTIIYVTRSFLAKKPEVVKKVVKGFMAGADFVMRNRGWAVEKLKSEYGFTPAGANEIYSQLTYGAEGKIIKKKLENALNFALEHGLLAKDKVPALGLLYAKEFAE